MYFIFASEEKKKTRKQKEITDFDSSSIVVVYLYKPVPQNKKKRKEEADRTDWEPGIQETFFSIKVAPRFNKQSKNEEEKEKGKPRRCRNSDGRKDRANSQTVHASALKPRGRFVLVVAIDALETEIKSLAALLPQTWEVADDGRFGLDARLRDGLGVWDLGLRQEVDRAAWGWALVRSRVVFGG